MIMSEKVKRLLHYRANRNLSKDYEEEYNRLIEECIDELIVLYSRGTDYDELEKDYEILSDELDSIKRQISKATDILCGIAS